VAPQQAAEDVEARFVARLHRLVPEMALDVLPERLHRLVARSGFLAQALGDDGVEIPLEPARRHRRFCLAAGGVARPRRRLFQQALERARHRQVGGAPRPHRGEQLEEHDTQRVDVGGRRHRVAGELLGGGVVGSERRPRRGVGGAAVGRVEQLGDAEVEQLHPAVAADQDVARLQVAMDDEVPVRVGDGVADLAEKPQPLLEVVAARSAVRDEGRAFDVFEHRVGPAVRRHAAVEDPRDPRVLETGEDLALGVETLELPRRLAAQHLDRHQLLEGAVDAGGGVDLARAAFTDEARHLPGAEPRAGREAVGVVGGADRLR
jgi:hypothetical protein